MNPSRGQREIVKSSLHHIFVLGQGMGFDFLPRHFFSSIPSINALRKTESWKLPMSMKGIAGTDLASQLDFLRECCTPALQEYVKSADIHARACDENQEAGGFGPIEADVLFCYIVSKRPAKIVQVGCGVSTSVILQAARKAGYVPHIVCIEPFPSSYLNGLNAQGTIELIPHPAQDVDLSVFTTINSGDLFFVDSTHAVRPGSEVNRIILEVLPQLPTGSQVHFHDIWWPYDYQPSLLTNLFFHGESTLLHAFMVGNERYSIAVSLSMLHFGRQEEMRSILPNYRPALTDHGLWKVKGDGHLPVSTYLSVH